MRKSLTIAMAALTFGGAVAAAALPAQARDHDGGYRDGGYRGGGYYHGGHDRGHGRNNDGAAIVAGIAGLAIGAALADGGHSYAYNRGGYYQPGYYYDGGYAYAPAYRVCSSSRWVWDPYLRRDVLVRDSYAC